MTLPFGAARRSTIGRYRISESAHKALPWLVHDLLSDVPLEDVWRFPLELGPDDDLETFRREMGAAVEGMGRRSPVAILFAARMAIGRVFGWDRRSSETRPRQLRARYAAATGIDPDLYDSDAAAEFSLVYRLPDEHLTEIENRTVLAALHLGRVPTADGRSAVNLAVYSQPKGLLGTLYMLAIKPFRHWIVYPAIIKATTARWEARQGG